MQFAVLGIYATGNTTVGYHIQFITGEYHAWSVRSAFGENPFHVCLGHVAFASKLHGHGFRAIKAGAEEHHTVANHRAGHHRIAVVGGAPNLFAVGRIIGADHVAAGQEHLRAGGGLEHERCGK